MARLFWILFALAMIIYLAMIAWTLPEISADAGGLPAFDLRPMGYSTEEARAFLSALSDAGRALYLGPQALLDLAYPALLAAVLTMGVTVMLRPGFRWLRWATAAAGIAGAGCDYLENMLVRGLLRADPAAVTDSALRAASTATILKSAFSTLAFTLFLVSLAIWAWRRLRRKPVS